MKSFIKYLIIFILIIFILPVILTNRKIVQVTSEVNSSEKEEATPINLRRFYHN